LAGKTYSRDVFHVEGFPYKDQIEELFIVMVYCMYSQYVTSTFSLISFLKLQHTFRRHDIGSLFVMKVPFHSSQSVAVFTCYC